MALSGALGIRALSPGVLRKFWYTIQTDNFLNRGWRFLLLTQREIIIFDLEGCRTVSSFWKYFGYSLFASLWISSTRSSLFLWSFSQILITFPSNGDWECQDLHMGSVESCKLSDPCFLDNHVDSNREVLFKQVRPARPQPFLCAERTFSTWAQKKGKNAAGGFFQQRH